MEKQQGAIFFKKHMFLKEYIKKPFLFALFNLGRMRDLYSRQEPIELDRIERIMILQLGGIGDVLLIFPLLRELKQAFPNKSLMTVTEYGHWLFELAPDLLEGISHQRLDLSTGYREKLGRIRHLSKDGIDLVVSTARGDGAIESSVVSWLTGSHFRIGFRQEGSRFLYTHTRDFSYHDSIVDQNLGLLQMLRCGATDNSLGLHLEKGLEVEGRRMVDEKRAPDGVAVVFHPFAGNFDRLKVWPVSRYVQLAKKLIDECSATIIILGSVEDRELWEAECPDSLRHKTSNLCGEISFVKSAAVIKHCDLFIGNDSSLLHLAESFSVPAIGIFGSTSPTQILPRKHTSDVVCHEVSCSPCYLHQPMHIHCCQADIACLKHIEVKDVFDVAAAKLTSSEGCNQCVSP